MSMPSAVKNCHMIHPQSTEYGNAPGTHDCMLMLFQGGQF
jgi:hypothetical protein